MWNMKPKDPNQLPVEVRIDMVNGKRLVEETRTRVKEQHGAVDLTCRMQLRDDCAAVEKLIRKLEKGIYKEKDVQALHPAILRLQTTSDGILKQS